MGYASCRVWEACSNETWSPLREIFLEVEDKHLDCCYLNCVQLNGESSSRVIRCVALSQIWTRIREKELNFLICVLGLECAGGRLFSKVPYFVEYNVHLFAHIFEGKIRMFIIHG